MSEPSALGRLLTKVTGTRAAYTGTYNRAGNRLTEASTITGDPANGTAVTTYDPLDRLAAYSLPGLRTLGPPSTPSPTARRWPPTGPPSPRPSMPPTGPRVAATSTMPTAG